MTLPKTLLLDRDGCICANSSDPLSPLYYLLRPEHLVLKPGVQTALDLIRVHAIPTILVTKQRCIGKGLVTRAEVDIIHARLQRMTGFTFDQILVEPEAENKAALFRNVLFNRPDLNPQDIVLFDDSCGERTVAQRLGITAVDGSDLHAAVCGVLAIRA